MSASLILCCSVLLLLLLQQVAPALNPRQPEARGVSAATWRGQEEVTVPFEYFRQHIYISVAINGKPGFLFMLDSGANRNVLNLRTARELGMRPKLIRQEKKVGFGSAPIYTAPQEDMRVELGTVPVVNRVAVLDLSAFERHFGHQTDGMLGYPFLRRFIVKLDFEKKLLTLIPAQKRLHSWWSIEVPLAKDGNFVLVPVRISEDGYPGREFKAAVDTGSNGTLMVYERFVPALHLRDSLMHSEPALCFGLNGYYSVSAGTIDSFVLGDALARNMPVDYLAEEEEVGPEHAIPGAIGNGILANFRQVIFDVPHQRMMFSVRPPALTTGVVRTASGYRP